MLKRFRHRNLIFVGIALLLIFGGAVWLIGRKINATANRMHTAMIEDSGKYRAELIALDFQKTVELSTIIHKYVVENTFEEEELQDLLRGLIRLDRKITRIWYSFKGKDFICIDSNGVIPQDAVFRMSLEKLSRELQGKQKNRLYYEDGVLFWTLCAQCEHVTFGLDVSLPGLHAYFASMSPQVKSYASVLNGEGIYIVHPDESQIGRSLTDTLCLEQFRKALWNNKVVFRHGFSNYLLLPVERIYYPILVGKERWMVMVNVPDLVTEEEMQGFHRYTLWIVVFTVLIFSVLLAFSEYKWRKEYDRRRKLEQETLQLNLQQLKNQVNPHFLFNSLNSLSALIGTEPLLAKEFVLKLSKIYRYVLEKRNESLVSVCEEVEFLRHYYFLQHIRFGEKLKLEIAENLVGEKRKIPSMSLQMLIENAVKHNEITSERPLIIRIYEETASLVVANSYCPRPDASPDSLGIGFENINKVYAYCSEKQFTYNIEGDQFICILPFIG